MITALMTVRLRDTDVSPLPRNVHSIFRRVPDKHRELTLAINPLQAKWPIATPQKCFPQPHNIYHSPLYHLHIHIFLFFILSGSLHQSSTHICFPACPQTYFELLKLVAAITTTSKVVHISEASKKFGNHTGLEHHQSWAYPTILLSLTFPFLLHSPIPFSNPGIKRATEAIAGVVLASNVSMFWAGHSNGGGIFLFRYELKTAQ